MNVISLEPPRYIGHLLAEDELTRVALTGNMHRLTRFTATDCDAWVDVALTPSSTTVTIGPDGVSQATISGATARMNQFCGTDFAKARHLRVWARRKPGTSGAITAQKILVKCWNGSALAEVARLYVGADSGAGEPATDIVDIQRRNTADSLINFLSAHPLNLVFDSADSDLEVVIQGAGLSA